MSSYEPMQAVIVTDAFGTEHRATAVSGVERGDKFPIVWVRFADGDVHIPWPLDAVRPADDGR